MLCIVLDGHGLLLHVDGLEDPAVTVHNLNQKYSKPYYDLYRLFSMLSWSNEGVGASGVIIGVEP